MKCLLLWLWGTFLLFFCIPIWLPIRVWYDSKCRFVRAPHHSMHIYIFFYCFLVRLIKITSLTTVHREQKEKRDATSNVRHYRCNENWKNSSWLLLDLFLSLLLLFEQIYIDFLLSHWRVFVYHSYFLISYMFAAFTRRTRLVRYNKVHIALIAVQPNIYQPKKC